MVCVCMSMAPRDVRGRGSVNNKGSKRSARLDLSLRPERNDISDACLGSNKRYSCASRGVSSAAALRRAVSNPIMY